MWSEWYPGRNGNQRWFFGKWKSAFGTSKLSTGGNPTYLLLYGKGSIITMILLVIPITITTAKIVTTIIITLGIFANIQQYGNPTCVPKINPPNWSLILGGLLGFPWFFYSRFISDLMTGVIRLVLRCFCWWHHFSLWCLFDVVFRTKTPISFLKDLGAQKRWNQTWKWPRVTTRIQISSCLERCRPQIRKTTTAQSGALHHDGWCLLFTSREWIGEAVEFQ